MAETWLDTYLRALALVTRDPLALDAHDLAVLKTAQTEYGSRDYDDALDARVNASDGPPTPPPLPAPVPTVAAWRAGEDIDDFFRRAAGEAAPLAIVAALWHASSSHLKERRLAIEALERRVTELEHKSFGVQWEGVWRDGHVYEAARLVTDKGSLWLSTERTAARPGSAPDWKLIVKSGAFGSRQESP